MEDSPMFLGRKEFVSRAREAVGLLRGKRNSPEEFENEVKSVDSSQQRAASPVPAKKKARKSPNYLRHGDRCCIIKRVAGGEQQAALAREFGVTRAAVCQMYKNRDEILSREDEPQPRPSSVVPQTSLIHDNRVTQPHINPQSGETIVSNDLKMLTRGPRSKKVSFLLTLLQDTQTSPVMYRRAAARLTFVLVEEALASYDDKEVECVAASGHASSNTAFCAVTLGDESSSFVSAFSQIDPEVSTGEIHVEAERNDDHISWQLEYLDVPDDIINREVLLFSTSANGGAECKAIEVLRRIGVVEGMITLVMVVCSSRGYEEISGRYPRVKIISAAIGDEWILQLKLRFQNVVPGAYAHIQNDPSHR